MRLLRRFRMDDGRAEEPVELRIAAPDYAALRAHLLSDPAVEQLAMLFCGRHVAADGRTILLVREVLPAPPEALEQQSIGHVTATHAFSRGVLLHAREEGLDLIDAHSHPFSDGPAAFSATDDANERTLARYIGTRIPGMWYGALVFTQTDVAARLWRGGEQQPVPVERIIVGDSPLRVIQPRTARPATTEATAPHPSDWQPFARQVLAWGRDGQARLTAASVAVVGAGGLGSVVATQLAHLGIGRLVLVDDDVVDHTNLNRLVGAGSADAEAHRPKVDVLARYARAVRPALRVETVRGRVDSPEGWQAVAGCDAVMVCVDNDGARLVANRLAAQYHLPLIDVATGIRTDGAGAITEAGGQVRCVLPGGFCLQCIDGLDLTAAGRDRAPDSLRALYRQRGYVLTEDVPAPSVLTLNTTVATEAVNELLALFTGLRPAQPYLLYDFLQTRWTALRGSRRDGCVVCSRDAYYGLGDREPPPGVPDLANVPPAVQLASRSETASNGAAEGDQLAGHIGR